MIDYIIGEIRYIGESFLIIEVQSFGLKVFFPKREKDSLLLNNETKLYTFFYISDQQQKIYGFLNPEERDFFLVLMKINGVGPNKALSILSQYNLEELKNIIDSSDIESLISVSGIGKKKSQRIILELKGNINILSENSSDKRILNILTRLGLSGEEAKKYIRMLNPHKKMSVSEIVRKISKLRNENY